MLPRLRSLGRLSLCRGLASANNTSLPPISQIPMTEPLPHLPAEIYDTKRAGETKLFALEDSPAQITTLGNGLRVASVPHHGQFCTVGVCIDSGPRYELPYVNGISHFLEKLAFGTTENYPDPESIQKVIEKYGAIVDCQAVARDSFIFASSFNRKGLEPMLSVIADAVLRPKFTDEEMEGAKMAVQFDIHDTGMRPEQEIVMQEAIHAAAFSNNSLGMPKLCPEQNVDSISRELLMSFLSSHHSPDRMVLAGVGVDHGELVTLAERYFEQMPASWSAPNKPIIDASTAQYTGGLFTLEKDLSRMSAGPNDFPELCHLSIGLEGVSHQHPDFITSCVMNMLMGGGGSFSAGGPGKGMYTRLYLNALNRFHFLYSCTAFNHAYLDAGVFCITASAPPQKMSEMAAVVAREFGKLGEPIGDEEFQRAKKQLTSMLVMNLESRTIVFEDLARQVLVHNQRYSASHYMEQIAAVTKEDLNRLAEKMLNSKPAVAAVGNLKNMPSFDHIQGQLLQYQPQRMEEARKNLKLRDEKKKNPLFPSIFK